MPSTSIDRDRVPVLAEQIYAHRAATTEHPEMLIAIHRWTNTGDFLDEITVTYIGDRQICPRRKLESIAARMLMRRLAEQLATRGERVRNPITIRGIYARLTGAPAAHCSDCGYVLAVGAVRCDWCGLGTPARRARELPVPS